MQKPALFETENKKYYYENLIRALKKVDLKKGDEVFVHSDLGHFGKISDVRNKNQFLDFFIRALLETIGKEGTLIIPTFTYSYCNKQIYDPKESPSTIGILTEYFRKQPGVVRSLDAIFSISAVGKKKNYFSNVGLNCFGQNSIFDKLYKKNVTILFIGDTFDITFMHYVEKKHGVNYRFDKEFKGQTRIEKKLKNFSYTYFVRYLDKNVSYNLDKIRKYLDKQKVLKKAKLGFSSIISVTAQDAFKSISQGLDSDPYLLLKENPNL